MISTQNHTFPEIADVQLDYLRAALERCKTENYAGALILAHNHPADTAGNKHGWSIELTAEGDTICAERGVWPHDVLSAYAHIISASPGAMTGGRRPTSRPAAAGTT